MSDQKERKAPLYEEDDEIEDAERRELTPEERERLDRSGELCLWSYHAAGRNDEGKIVGLGGRGAFLPAEHLVEVHRWGGGLVNDFWMFVVIPEPLQEEKEIIDYLRRVPFHVLPPTIR